MTSATENQGVNRKRILKNSAQEKRNVLITGCSSGIGFALAQAFIQNGDRVIATARKPAAIESLRKAGCDTQALDVNDAASRKQLADYLAQRNEPVDILINNAGISAMGPMVEIPEHKLRQQFETNVIAPVLLTQALLPLLRNSRQPLIINVGSISGVLTTPFAGAYCASKAALHSISDAMRMELAPFGIDVITVQPGAIKSNFGQAAEQGVKDWLTEDSLYHSIRDGILSRATASQEKATPAGEFAGELIAGVNAVMKAKATGAGVSGATLNIGRGSRFYPLLARWLPEQAKSRLLQRRFGLHRLVQQ